jgi:hypothetical protein
MTADGSGYLTPLGANCDVGGPVRLSAIHPYIVRYIIVKGLMTGDASVTSVIVAANEAYAAKARGGRHYYGVIDRSLQGAPGRIGSGGVPPLT